MFLLNLMLIFLFKPRVILFLDWGFNKSLKSKWSILYNTDIFRDIVLVEVQYRLGPLGKTSFSEINHSK